MAAEQLPRVEAVDLESRKRTLLRSVAALRAVEPGGGPSAGPWAASAPAVDAPVAHAASADVASLIDASSAARRAIGARLLDQPLVAARRVDVAIDRLRSYSSIAELERAVPEELCWAGGFDRVLYSRVDGSSWRPIAWHSPLGLAGPAEDEFRSLVRGPELHLPGGSVEAEVVRRRLSALVVDRSMVQRGVASIVDVVNSRGFVAAPIIASDKVVGLLHADVEGGRELTECDRVAVQAFADGLGLTFERLALLEQLALQNGQIKAALEAAAHEVDALAAAPIRLVAPVPQDAEPEHAAAASAYPSRLTEREREVFELLVSGATNGQIADRLTVSETTVKSHVKHILRKLHATNRAEAIAQFLKTRGGRP